MSNSHEGIDFDYTGPAPETDKEVPTSYITPDFYEKPYAEKLTTLNLDIGRTFKDEKFTTEMNDMMRMI